MKLYDLPIDQDQKKVIGYLWQKKSFHEIRVKVPTVPKSTVMDWLLIFEAKNWIKTGRSNLTGQKFYVLNQQEVQL